MNKGLLNFVSRSALLCASLMLAFTLLAGTASAHTVNDPHYLGGNHMYQTGYFDLADGGGDYLLSRNQRYQLIFQSDGNLVEYKVGNQNAIWASNTGGRGRIAQFQTDGNFVIYDANNNPIWATGTNGTNPGVILYVRNSGAIEIWDQFTNDAAGDNTIYSTAWYTF